MDYITFRDKEYPVRIFHVRNVEQQVEGIYTIAEDDLEDAMNLERDEPFETDDLEAINVDSCIYHYIPVGCINLSAEEICNKHLDMPFEFLEEH